MLPAVWQRVSWRARTGPHTCATRAPHVHNHQPRHDGDARVALGRAIHGGRCACFVRLLCAGGSRDNATAPRTRGHGPDTRRGRGPAQGWTGLEVMWAAVRRSTARGARGRYARLPRDVTRNNFTRNQQSPGCRSKTSP